jgi:ribonuclease G
MTLCQDIFREIERVSSDVGGNTILVDVNPEIAELLYEQERSGIERLEKKLGKKVVVKSVPRFHQEEFEIVEV